MPNTVVFAQAQGFIQSVHHRKSTIFFFFFFLLPLLPLHRFVLTGGDTMHMARLWDTSMEKWAGAGGFSLEALSVKLLGECQL